MSSRSVALSNLRSCSTSPDRLVRAVDGRDVNALNVPMAKRWIAPEYGDVDVLRFVEVDVPPPGPGEVTVDVRAAGMNAVDFKIISGAYNRNPDALPLVIGSEVSGVVTAIGEGAEFATGGGSVGDEVIAYRVSGGYATQLNAAASDVFAKPAMVGFPEAANLFL